MNLNMPTIEIVVLANYIALIIVWSYFARSYPNLRAARFWQASVLVAAAGGAIAPLRGIVHPLLPVVLGNGLMMLGCCLAWTGIREFYRRPAPVLTSTIITASTMVLLAAFTILRDDINTRIAIFSGAQCIPLLLALKDLRSRPGPEKSPGADLAYAMIVVIVAMHAMRSVAAFAGVGGQVSLVDLNGFQAAIVTLMLFAAMMTNFGFVLMVIDRLNTDLAALALVDDLTGVANRRHFLLRLADACADAARTGEPFALLVIDLDGFKAINDGYGHGAGDECLRAFTRAAQARLRAGDLLARSGGDEFCVILPSTTLSEAALVARNLIKSCRKTRVPWKGLQLPITASIGVAVWSKEIAQETRTLIAQADQALYIAKEQGRDRLAVYEDVIDRLRKSA